MSRDKKIQDLEKQLQQLKREEAATYAEAPGRSRSFGRSTRVLKLVPILIGIIVILIGVLAVRSIDIGAFMGGNGTLERKSAFVERLQESEELVTAEAYVKSVIHLKDNELLGFNFDGDLPGTRREVLMIYPGVVRAGIDLSGIKEEDVEINEELKQATIKVPGVKLIGEPTLDMKEVETYSYEGLFRGELPPETTNEKAAEAQELMKEEAMTQGLLALAETNAEKVLQDMFQLVEYEVTIEFEE